MRAAADRIAIRLQELAIGVPFKSAKAESTAEEQQIDSPPASSYTHFAFHHLPIEEVA